VALRTFNVFFGGAFYKTAEDEQPADVQGVELELDVEIDESIGKKDFEGQLRAVSETIKVHHEELLRNFVAELEESKYNFKAYHEAQWIVLEVENGNGKSLFERERDEGSSLEALFEVPLILAIKEAS